MSLDSPDSLALQDQRDPEVCRVKPVSQDLKAERVIKEPKGFVEEEETLDQWATLGLKEMKEPLVSLEPWENLDFSETQEIQESWV